MKLKLLVFLLCFYAVDSFAAACKKFPAWILGRFSASKVQQEAKICQACSNTKNGCLMCRSDNLNCSLAKANLPKVLIDLIVDYDQPEVVIENPDLDWEKFLREQAKWTAEDDERQKQLTKYFEAQWERKHRREEEERNKCWCFICI